MRSVVVTHAVRTPIGKFLGSLSGLTAVDLGEHVVRQLLARAKTAPERVERLYFGNARQAGAGPNPARQILVRAGMPVEATAMTVNMACASGLKSVALAARDIAVGEIDVAVAGGTESMSRLPYLLPRARDGYRLGHAPLVDAMYQDGFLCPLAGQLMGRTAETLAEEYDIPRSRQDAYAAQSQNRCEAARRERRFADEIVSVTVREKRGERVVTDDEHPRDGVTPEKMARLKPVFKEGGTVHPGNASGITDGAAALLVMAEEKARELGCPPLARIEGWAEAGVDPERMGIGPVPATRKLLDRLELQLDDFDLIELNEAFAAQVLACLDALGIDDERVNVNGGAIALGHPIGATGARIVTTLLHEMNRRGVQRGLATLCVSGGLGMAMSFVRDAS